MTNEPPLHVFTPDPKETAAENQPPENIIQAGVIHDEPFIMEGVVNLLKKNGIYVTGSLDVNPLILQNSNLLLLPINMVDDDDISIWMGDQNELHAREELRMVLLLSPNTIRNAIRYNINNVLDTEGRPTQRSHDICREILALKILGSADTSKPDELPDIVRNVFAWKNMHHKSISDKIFGAATQAIKREKISEGAKTARLTSRELEVLECIRSRLANKQIGRKLAISLYTVKNHVHNILEKLQAETRQDAVENAKARGLFR